MTHFFHQLRLYITFEVIEPAWLHMQARMKAAKTLDEVHLPTLLCQAALLSWRWLYASLMLLLRGMLSKLSSS